MFRAAYRLPKRTLLSASVAGIVAGQEHKEKLSIYPNIPPEILLVDAPSPLERHIGVVRRQVCQVYSDTHARVQSWVSKWIGVEHAVENRVKSIISPQESLTPGLLYVGIATLTGSIIGRNRFILTRFLLPPTFLIVSANHFLPKTTSNLMAYFGSLEDTYFPAFSEKHEIAKAHSSMAWERMKEGTENSRAQINRGAVVAVEKVQEVTGLKLRETFGWTEKAVEEVEKKAAEVATATAKKVEAGKDVVENQVQELKKAAEKELEKIKKQP